MNELIEKWKPILTFKFKDGKSVPENKYQECAEELEATEKKYEGNVKYLQELIPFCAWTYKTGIKYGGGIEELLEDCPSLKQSLIDESNKVYDLHAFGQGYIGKKTTEEKIEEYKNHPELKKKFLEKWEDAINGKVSDDDLGSLNFIEPELYKPLDTSS